MNSIYIFADKKAALRPLKKYYDNLVRPIYKGVKYPLQDETLPTFKLLKDAGYDKVRYMADEDSCPICRRNNGRVYNLGNFLAATTHDAPIFSHTHVNDKCFVEVFDSEDLLPPVVFDYRGIDRGSLLNFLSEVLVQMRELAKTELGDEYPPEFDIDEEEQK